jgi:MFS family permease
MITGGRLGEIFGHRRLFVHGTLGFAIASLLCALAAGRRAPRPGLHGCADDPADSTLGPLSIVSAPAGVSTVGQPGDCRRRGRTVSP